MNFTNQTDIKKAKVISCFVLILDIFNFFSLDICVCHTLPDSISFVGISVVSELSIMAGSKTIKVCMFRSCKRQVRLLHKYIFSFINYGAIVLPFPTVMRQVLSTSRALSPYIFQAVIVNSKVLCHSSLNLYQVLLWVTFMLFHFCVFLSKALTKERCLTVYKNTGAPPLYLGDLQWNINVRLRLALSQTTCGFKGGPVEINIVENILIKCEIGQFHNRVRKTRISKPLGGDDQKNNCDALTLHTIYIVVAVF